MQRTSRLNAKRAQGADRRTPSTVLGLGRFDILQRRAVGEHEPAGVPPIVHEVLRSPGQPLDAATRAFMEPRFRHDFSAVRVHTDAKAAQSARTVHALAYAIGDHVAFQAEEYAPRTSAGRRLIAHELAHVVQQARGGSAGDAEAAARQVAEHVARGQAVTPQQVGSAPLGLHRFEESADDNGDFEALDDEEESEAGEDVDSLEPDEGVGGGEDDDGPLTIPQRQRGKTGLERHFDEWGRSQAPSLFTPQPPLLFPGQLNLGQVPKPYFSIRAEQAVPPWVKSGVPNLHLPSAAQKYVPSEPKSLAEEQRERRALEQKIQFDAASGKEKTTEGQFRELGTKVVRGLVEAYFPKTVKQVKALPGQFLRGLMPGMFDRKKKKKEKKWQKAAEIAEMATDPMPSEVLPDLPVEVEKPKHEKARRRRGHDRVGWWKRWKRSRRKRSRSKF
jgi:uncharacterized protein DUF4157